MKKLNFLMITALLLGLAACSQNTLDPQVTRVGNTGNVYVTDLRSAVSPNQLLLAQGTFHNRASKPQTGFYRCQFFDANKMQLGAAQVWQPITLYPNEQQVVKCMATQTEAVDFKLEFSTDGKNVSILS